MLEGKLRGASTLNSYKYIRIEVGWILPLVSSLFLRDVTLASELQALVHWCFGCCYFPLHNNCVSSWEGNLCYFMKEWNKFVAFWSIRSGVLLYSVLREQKERLRTAGFICSIGHLFGTNIFTWLLNLALNIESTSSRNLDAAVEFWWSD